MKTIKTNTVSIFILLTILLSFNSINAQYSFSMTPLSGAAGTYVTFTGSSFIKGKTKAFLGDKELKVIYTTNLHLVVRIPENAKSGHITLKNNSRFRGFRYPKPFRVTVLKGSLPKYKGLYVAILDTDEGEGNIYLYKSALENTKTRVFHRDKNPVNYRRILSLACGNIEASLDCKTVYSVGKKPYKNNVPESALYISSSPYKLDEANPHTKRVYGYSMYHEISSLFIASLEGDKVCDLIYLNENTQALATTVFRKITSMPRDVPMFTVSSKLKIKNIAPVDIANSGKSKIALAYFSGGNYNVAVLDDNTDFNSKKVVFKSKYPISALTGSSSNSSGKLFFAVTKPSSVEVYALTSSMKVIKVFSKKLKGTITALALSDLDNNRQDELYIGLYSDSHASLIQLSSPLNLPTKKEKLIFRKFERVITALSMGGY